MILELFVVISVIYLIIGLFVTIYYLYGYEDTATSIYRGLFWGLRLSRDIFKAAIRDLGSSK